MRECAFALNNNGFTCLQCAHSQTRDKSSSQKACSNVVSEKRYLLFAVLSFFGAVHFCFCRSSPLLRLCRSNFVPREHSVCTALFICVKLFLFRCSLLINFNIMGLEFNSICTTPSYVLILLFIVMDKLFQKLEIMMQIYPSSFFCCCFCCFSFYLLLSRESGLIWPRRGFGCQSHCECWTQNILPYFKMRVFFNLTVSHTMKRTKKKENNDFDSSICIYKSVHAKCLHFEMCVQSICAQRYVRRIALGNSLNNKKKTSRKKITIERMSEQICRSTDTQIGRHW